MSMKSPLFYLLSMVVAGICGYMFHDGNIALAAISVLLAPAMLHFNFLSGGTQAGGVKDSEGFFAIAMLVGTLGFGWFFGQAVLWVIGAAFCGLIVSAVLVKVSSQN